MPLSDAVVEYYSTHREEHLSGLFELLRIPSMSAIPAHAPDIRRAAQFLVDDLARMGMRNARTVEGKGHPLVCAEWLDAPGKPTVVIYGHYDVQPPDPLEEWETPPFEPTVRGENVYARGAVDDKGQMFLLLKALEGLLKTEGRLPVNVKILIEGEEESDGGVIRDYLAETGTELGADVALICDTEMFEKGLPTINIGLRGMIYAEITVQGARNDLHSGMYGGIAPNPFQGLAQILAGLKDPEGRILIPGVYDDVQPPSAEEKAAWARLPFDEDRLLREEVGSKSLVGEPGFSALERLWVRPTFEIHGMPGGFTAEGAKTVIPAKATAKVSLRLVPDMDPDKIARALVDRVAALEPEGMTTRVRIMAKAPASITPPDDPFVRKAADSLTETFGRETVFIRSGGSIPVVGLFERYAGIPSVLMGFGLPDDNLHAPNEKFHLPNFYQGIEAVGRYLTALGEGD